MARGDVRRFSVNISVTAGVPFSLSATCNSNEAITGAGWYAPGLGLDIASFNSVSIDTWQLDATPAASGTVSLIAHAIEV
jgi:hypothetical protein